MRIRIIPMSLCGILPYDVRLKSTYCVPDALRGAGIDSDKFLKFTNNISE